MGIILNESPERFDETILPSDQCFRRNNGNFILDVSNQIQNDQDKFIDMVNVNSLKFQLASENLIFFFENHQSEY